MKLLFKKTLFNNKGGALVQAMLSLTLLMIALENTLSTVAASSQLLYHQNRLSEGTQVGQSLMEDLLLASTSDADLSPGAHTANFDRTGKRTAGAGDFVGNWTITENTPFPKVIQLEIVVSWNEQGGSRTLKLKSFRN